jgi:hypothetical protein
MNHRRHITAATLALALLGTAAPALAADSLTTRVALGLGNAIAAQGNAAFQQIRNDLREELSERFHSLLPHNPAEQARTEPETESADDMPVSNH